MNKKEYLKTIEDLVKEYQPKIEKIFNTEVGEIKVYPYSKYFQNRIEEELDGDESYFSRLFFKAQMWYENLNACMCAHALRREIYIQTHYLARTFGKKTAKIQLMHELTHIISAKLIDRLPLSEFLYMEKFLSEGLAEYVTCEFKEFYDKDSVWLAERLEKIQSEKLTRFDEMMGILPYKVGYQFFKKVTDVIGRENFLKIFKNPPKSLDELIEPQNYIERLQEKVKKNGKLYL